MGAAANQARAAQVRAGALAWIPLLVGLLLAMLAVRTLAGQAQSFKPDEAAMGQQTRPYFGRVNGGQVHCQDNSDRQLCLDAYKAAGGPPAILWLGNSQLHGINRYRSGQSTAAMLVHEAMARRGQYLVAFSEPNANLAEQQLLFRSLRTDYEVRTLILAVCLDDFREAGVRDTLQAPPARAASIPKYASLQPLAEDRLNDALSSRLSFWGQRQNIKALVYYDLYEVRNRVLGINAQTKRPVSLTQYAEKMAILKAMLAEAEASGIRVVLYAPPYRSDVPGPYARNQYTSFLRDLKALARPGQVEVMDLTAIVPGPEWGMVKSRLFGSLDYDFMHFTAEGHRRLAENVIPAL